MVITVMGATGNVGTELVALLPDAGHDVRAVSSRERPADFWPSPVTPFVADLTSGDSLRGALTGADAAFMLSGYDDQGLIGELQHAGIARVALLSSGSVATVGSENAVAAYHLASEQALRESGIAWTFLRPNTFATNALRWAPAIRAGKPILAPFATVPIAVNDPRDVAAVARTALTEDGHGGRAYRITGPEALLPERQVSILGEALGRDLAFEAQSDADARIEMAGSMPTPYVDAFFEFFDEGRIDETTVLPTVTDVTGCEPRTFRDWAEEHAPAFT
jgi:uncharacterized protein YbjT (DUF2867 family)